MAHTLTIVYLMLCSTSLLWATEAGGDENVLELTLYAPKPGYPYAARGSHETGSGLAVVQIDKSTGNVTAAEMAVTTNNKNLDNAALEAFRQWRFKPNTIGQAKIPISFVLSDTGAPLVFLVKGQPASAVLARFLGKDNLVKSPVPQYPAKATWTNKEGTGVYQMIVDQKGTVTDVRILRTSGDATFDRVAVGTLHKWRFRKGPGTVQLPLAFKLAPHNFTVRIVR